MRLVLGQEKEMKMNGMLSILYYYSHTGRLSNRMEEKVSLFQEWNGLLRLQLLEKNVTGREVSYTALDTGEDTEMSSERRLVTLNSHFSHLSFAISSHKWRWLLNQHSR